MVLKRANENFLSLISILAVVATSVSYWSGISSTEQPKNKTSVVPNPSQPSKVPDSPDQQSTTPLKQIDLKTKFSRNEKPAGRPATIDDLLLFYPDKYPLGIWEQPQLKATDVWFDSFDRTRLHGWYLEPESPTHVILFSHGNGGNLSHRSQILNYLRNDIGASVLIYDYRGYGRSEGQPTVAMILEDAKAARAKLASLASIDSKEIILMGRSLGGAVSIQLAADETCRALIVESTFSSVREIAQELAPPQWQIFVPLIPIDKLNSVAAIQNHNGPYFQSHGTKDQLIPIEIGRMVYQAANNPKTWVEIADADHNQIRKPDYLEKLTDFFRKTAKHIKPTMASEQP